MAKNEEKKPELPKELAERLEAKMDQLLADNKALQKEVSELKEWNHRIVRRMKQTGH